MKETHSNFGKWSQPGVPHRGWECVDVYDSCGDGEELHRTCDMCEHQPIRYVHVMTHPKHEQLECGCVCAGRMEENYAEAVRREKLVRSRSARRSRFPGSKGWKTSEKGNPHIKVDGHHVVVVHRRGTFGLGVTPSWSDEIKWMQKRYATKESAQLGAFDLIEKCNKRAAERDDT